MEDFAAPEGRGTHLIGKIRSRLGEVAAGRALQAWAVHEGKRGEICDTLSWSWGYHERNDSTHIGPDEVAGKLGEAWRRNSNLLINTAPLPDGSVPEPDVATLTELGGRIRAGDIPEGDADAFGDSLPTGL